MGLTYKVGEVGTCPSFPTAVFSKEWVKEEAGGVKGLYKGLREKGTIIGLVTGHAASF